jgi:hypothetical protein
MNQRPAGPGGLSDRKMADITVMWSPGGASSAAI